MSRRTCYIAPERFLKVGQTPEKTGLEPTMDIFSLGCVIAELFLEGIRLFDLSQLLAYREGHYDPAPVIDRIPNKHIQDIVLHMIQKNPLKRYSAAGYLTEWSPALFPKYYENLHTFVSQMNVLDPDQKISHTAQHLPDLLAVISQQQQLAAVPSSVLCTPAAAAAAAAPSRGVVASAPPTILTALSVDKTLPPATPVAAATAPAVPATHAHSAMDQTKRSKMLRDTVVRRTSLRIPQLNLNVQQKEHELPEDSDDDEEGDGEEEEDDDEEEEEREQRHDDEDQQGGRKSVERTPSSTQMSVTGERAGERDRRNPLESLVVVVPSLTSAIRGVQFASTKLVMAKLIRVFARHVTDEDRMQRLLPYTMLLLSDEAPLVRALAIKALAFLLKHVKHLPTSDAQVFPEYILPALLHIKNEEKSELVRIFFARHLPSLADSSRRFLESAYLFTRGTSSHLPFSSQQELFEKSLVTLQRGFHDIVQDILTRNVTSAIKRAFLTDIVRLCTFFGHQRANDFLLPLIISFLNDKDWRVRCAFFVHIVGVSVFVGRNSLESFILPCIQQAFSDQEEFVVDKAIGSVACLCELNMFGRRTLFDLCEKLAPFLLHPNVWIRYGVIAVIDRMARHLTVADVQCFVLPCIRPFLAHELLTFTEVNLLQCALTPVTRQALSKALQLNLDEVSPQPPVGGAETSGGSVQAKPMPAVFSPFVATFVDHSAEVTN
eukprot:TRINITY_DN459_c0_g1_i1.p1 TRINITY_DN459_c0_g1~~TRINITY_DN459_c0_g1_i1.p1  ORF type:complete len:719 (-),score=185.59 TRINITY_DN459_c0_g1_i1:99-2255(-)